VTRPAALAWGRRYLLCPPTHFGVLYEINPWMRSEVPVDRDRAQDQWEGLRATLEAAGAEVVVQEPHEGVPDLVFTANAGLVSGRRFVPSHFRHPERQPETAIDAAWAEANGFEVRRLPDGLAHEGAGDALPFGGVLLSGHRYRSDEAAAAELSRLLEVPVLLVEQVDPRYYHLDITFCPLDERRAMVWPGAWSAAGQEVVLSLVPEPLVLEEDEAAAFCANSVVVDRTVVMPSCPPRVGRQLEAWGFEPVEVDVERQREAAAAAARLQELGDVDLSRR
jgi:N-dimethylarginine dimethylaminohydrolase